MTTKLVKNLKQLRETNIKDWTTTLWLVKRKLTAGNAAYSVMRVDTEKKLQTKLKKILSDRFQNKEYQIEEYSFLNADQDNRLFTIEASETDFNLIQAEIKNGLANDKAKTYSDLLNSWAYVVEIKNKNSSVFGLRKINSMTQPKKVKAVSSFIFENQILKDLEEEQVFTIDTNIDFFVYDGTVFITNKREFESALNFRKGMEDNRDNVLDEFLSLGLFNNVEPIRKIVGSNLHYLRKISAVQKSAYYKDKTFLKNLIEVNIEAKWGLVIEDNKLIVTEENVDLVLTLLNNSRLKSQINQEVFDASVKKKVG